MATQRRSQSRWLARKAGVGWLMLCLLLPACQSTKLGDSSAHTRPPEAVQHPMLGGIPLPRGFAVVTDKSKAWESGRHRFASYEFIGSVSRDTVHEFFLNHMPTANFKLLQRRDDRGEYILSFTSSTEECSIRIGNRRYKTYIVVDVGPLPQGATRESQDLPPPRNP